MPTNREAAGANLSVVSVAGAAEEDEDVAVTYAALVGIGHALLDVADAIREQTDALAPSYDGVDLSRNEL